MAKSEIVPLCMDLIKTDGGTQMRAQLREDVVEDYRDKWTSGTVFDPIDVFHDGKHYWLADGFHRFFGAQHAKRSSIPCTVRQGTLRDAILFAVGANQRHGLRRSNEDKRNAVKTLMNDTEWVSWSDVKIAEQAGVSQEFCRQVRAQLTTVVGSPAEKAKDAPRVGKDGKKRKPPKSKPPKKLRSQSDEPSNGAPDAPETSAEAAPAPILDKFKKAVPENIEPAFAAAEKFGSLMATISDCKSKVKEIGEAPGGEWLDVQEAERLLEQARLLIRFAKPHTECAKCQRKVDKKCPTCKGLGWVNETMFKTAFSDPDKAWLEARA